MFLQQCLIPQGNFLPRRLTGRICPQNVRLQGISQGIQCPRRIRASLVRFVEKEKNRDAGIPDLPVNGFRSALNPVGTGDHQNTQVHDQQRPSALSRKILMSRCIDQDDFGVPVKKQGRLFLKNGNPSLLLQRLIVHERISVIHPSGGPDSAGMKQNLL